MGYTALKKMREINRKKYNIDGSAEPAEIPDNEMVGNIERYALKFIADIDGIHRVTIDRATERKANI